MPPPRRPRRRPWCGRATNINCRASRFLTGMGNNLRMSCRAGYPSAGAGADPGSGSPPPPAHLRSGDRVSIRRRNRSPASRTACVTARSGSIHMTARRTIVVVTDEPLFPTNRGSRARVVTLIRSLRALGFFVVLVTRTTRRVRALQMRWLVDRLVLVTARRFPGGSPLSYDSSPFHRPLQQVVEQFTPVAVIAEYIWMAPCLDIVPPTALRLVDTIDLMHVRRDFENRVANVWVTCTPDEERQLLQNADVIIAIQKLEQDAFRRLVPDRQVICLPHYVPV